MEYIVPSLRIVAIAEMTDVDVVKERLLQLVQLEEECFVVGYDQNVEKGGIVTPRNILLKLKEH